MWYQQADAATQLRTPCSLHAELFRSRYAHRDSMKVISHLMTEMDFPPKWYCNIDCCSRFATQRTLHPAKSGIVSCLWDCVRQTLG